MAEQFTNAVQTTLSGAITNVATSLTVTSATGFPSAVGTFRIGIESEILICTSRTGAVCTVTRGAEGTTAAAHASGVAVKLSMTAGSLAAAIADQVAIHLATADPHTVYVLKTIQPVAGTYTWYLGSPGGGGGIDSLVIDENPNRTAVNITAGGDNSGPKLSTNGGFSWTPGMGKIYNAGYGSLFQWPGVCQSRDFTNYPNRRFGASNGGLYVSENKGLDWTVCNLPAAAGGAAAPSFSHNSPGKGNGIDLEPDVNQSRVGATTLYAFHGNIDTGASARPRVVGRIIQDDGQGRLFMIDNGGGVYRWDYPANPGQAAAGGTLVRIANMSSTTRGCSVLTSIRGAADLSSTVTAFTGTNSPVASWEGKAVNEGGQVTLYVASALNPDVATTDDFVRIRQTAGAWTAGGTWTSIAPANGGKNGWCCMDAIRVGSATHVSVGTQNAQQNASTGFYSDWYVTSNGDGTPTWTSCTDGATISMDWHQGGPTGLVWWGSVLPKQLYGSANCPSFGGGNLGNGATSHTYTPEGVYFDPLDSSKVYVVGSAGVFMTNRTTLKTHPMMAGLGTLSNTDMKVDPNNANRAVMGNNDHTFLGTANGKQLNADGTYGTWVKNENDTPGTMLGAGASGKNPFFDTGRTPSAVFIPFADRNTEAAAELFYNRDPMNITTGVAWEPLGLQAVVGALGRSRGGASRRVGTTMIVLVAVSSKGIYKRTFTAPDANPPTGGTWALGAEVTHPFQTMDATDDGAVDVNFISDTVAFAYDRKTGLWRTADAGGTWTKIWAATAGVQNEGYFTPEIPGSNILWLTIGTGASQGLWKITNADNGTMNVNGTNLTGTAVAALQTPGGAALTQPNVVRSAPGRGVFVIDNANPDPKVWLTTDSGATWTNVADALAKRALKKVYGGDMGTDGTIYANCSGPGLFVGILA